MGLFQLYLKVNTCPIGDFRHFWVHPFQSIPLKQWRLLVGVDCFSSSSFVIQKTLTKSLPAGRFATSMPRLAFSEFYFCHFKRVLKIVLLMPIYWKVIKSQYVCKQFINKSALTSCVFFIPSTIPSRPSRYSKWSWRESNPRPNRETIRFLHAYSGLHFRVAARPGPPTATLSPKTSSHSRGTA